ncbi:MAG TPA: class I SAM-dependent methyltransferase [Phenylobacterium sp.]|nr:class I SAM-dependent methyltransferase [Phenylobacterium sp.]
MQSAPPTLAAGDLTFESIAAPYQRFVLDYLSLYGIDPARFCRPLPGADEMFFKAVLPNYEQDTGIGFFKFTESTLRFFDAYRQIVSQLFGGFENLRSVMDFASGYGRLTRILEQKLEPRQIWVSDIYQDAMAYQGRAFGVNTVNSTPDPAAYMHAGLHDIVFVGSLFSHLPIPLFHAWLERLYRLVAPGGVLAFSVHDEGYLAPAEPRDPSGLSYFRMSESGTLDADIYGMSYVTEAFVGGAIARLPDRPSWRRFPKGLYENQDLYVVGGPGRDVSGLRVASSPMGGFETATALTNGDLEFSGWAIERTPRERIERLRVMVDGVERVIVPPAGERRDVLAHFPDSANAPVGWSFRLRRDETATGALVRVGLESSSGLSGYAYVDFPPAVSMTYSGWSRRALRRP